MTSTTRAEDLGDEYALRLRPHRLGKGRHEHRQVAVRDSPLASFVFARKQFDFQLEFLQLELEPPFHLRLAGAAMRQFRFEQESVRRDGDLRASL